MRPKVVKILCSRIVITNENRAEIENFIDDIKKLNVFFEVTGSGNAHILDISADDGKLYEVCCVVSSFILATEVKKTARCILNAEYPNFNRDEKILIVTVNSANCRADCIYTSNTAVRSTRTAFSGLCAVTSTIGFTIWSARRRTK